MGRSLSGNGLCWWVVVGWVPPDRILREGALGLVTGLSPVDEPLVCPRDSFPRRPPRCENVTCRRSFPGRSPEAPGSWASPWTRRSRQERWSAAGVRHRLCRRRGRRGARGCIRVARGRRTCAGPCGTWSGCRCRPGPGVGCRRRRTPSAAAGTSRPRCRLWQRPDTGSLGSPRSRTLWGGGRW